MSQSRPVSSAAAAWVGVVVVGAVHDRAGSVPGVVATGAVPDETGVLDATVVAVVAVVEVGDESVDGVDDVEALDPPAMLEQAASATVATTTNARRGAENKRERR